MLEVWERTKRTIVFVTHDIMEALILADRIAMMTVGPGSRVSQIIDLDLPRPRNPGDAAIGRLFAELENRLLNDHSPGTV